MPFVVWVTIGNKPARRVSVKPLDIQTTFSALAQGNREGEEATDTQSH